MCKSYLTFEQYTSLGGKAEAASFRRLALQAQKRLDYWTMDRLTCLAPDDSIWPDVRLCMSLIVDMLSDIQTGSGGYTSFSNDGVSVSFGTVKTDEQRMASVYDQVVEILPVELVSRVVM